MEITARDFDQKSAQILAAAARGETVTVTKNGTPGARVVPINDTEVPRTRPTPWVTSICPTWACPASPTARARTLLRAGG
ncbi:type II toxin-antitoxin system prevent-host-death family antitoxin [Streptomyces sp. NPDC094149]|uniref:type II toxin-antitoxin system Phd/YefM family antitoxin n=1 Tax=Streptomyces sp. NPDC094149 TaxID=3155079 RepID=UPI003330B305